MKFFSLKKINSNESWKIRGIIVSIVGVSFLSIFVSPYKFFYKLVIEKGLHTADKSYCLMLDATGIPCPFCGLARGFLQFTKLNFEKSFYYNPSSLFLFVFGGLIMLVVFSLSIFNYKIDVKNHNIVWFVILIVFIVVWILNIIWGHQ
ncbi:DUF2752 domain-containing protein [Bacteroidota bacterium]